MNAVDNDGNGTLKRALRLAELGFYVFPVEWEGKHPMCKWSKSSTTDPDELVQLWDRGGRDNPKNIGIDCGKSGLVVIDEDELDAFGDFAEMNGHKIPPTLTVRTAKGRHFYFAQPDDVELTNREGRLPKSIDVRGVGGYVLAPGSRHASGAAYAIEVEGEPAECPSWLVDVLADREATGETSEPGWWRTGQIPPGRRDTALFKAACWARGEGMAAEDAEEVLAEVLERCEPEVTEHGEHPRYGMDHARAKIEYVWRIYKEGREEVTSEGLEPVDVTNPATAAKWLKRTIGRGKLSGMFVRGGEIVYTPRVGEDGYIPLVESDEEGGPEEERPHDGPAQVRTATPDSLAARIDFNHKVTRVKKEEVIPALFPTEAAKRVLAVPDLMDEVRPLRGVVHTPIVRPDGTILAEPGYDAATGMLYLPDPNLIGMLKPKAKPGSKAVESAKRGIEQLIREFEFETPNYRINYIGALLTPILRAITPPPYKLFALDAPVKGTGKTTAANVIRYIHGGVFRTEMPENAAELRKQITSILDVTTAPVVIIDNVTGMIRSSVLAGLLTSDQWDDRELGKSRYIQAKNDRIWIATGNNVQFGGDLPRRVFWCRLNANHPQPWKRTFDSDILSMVQQRRADFVWCLLTLVSHWVAEGMQVAPINTAYSGWTNTVNAILQTAGYEGEFDAPDSIRQERDPQEEEWYAFIAAVRERFGGNGWTAKHVLEMVDDNDFPRESLPGDLPQRAGYRATDLVRTLGNWLKNRVDVWAVGEESDPPLILRKSAGKESATRLQLWSIEVGKLPE
ncbi:bifunctional DNA primase/polymerase [Glycomyces sp. NPDC021274]|uniref:bifunctional DNA primase/polymerase n=1 Tax=Glycomyces sp. NPDC021274 TaxID=3155120 RepID=UPI00340FBC8A